MSILSELKTVCPFPEVFEDVENPGEISPRYRRKVGHIRADHDGYRWWNTVWPTHRELGSKQIAQEIDRVYEALTAKDAFADLPALRGYCENHPEALAIPCCSTEYNFYYEGELCFFWIRCITRNKDYNLYLHAFVKEPVAADGAK